MFCSCERNGIAEVIGLCDVNSINISNRNWTQISIPEVLSIPCKKPPIESIDKVFVNVKIISKRIVSTPNSSNNENPEGTKLTGKKLIVEGLLQLKVIYTADERTQPVHSADFCVLFSAFIVVPTDASTNPNAYCVDTCVEDVFVKTMDPKEIFSNVTLLLNARTVIPPC